jgi:hypothetical protein
MVGLYKGIIGAEEEEFLGETWSSGGIFRPPHGKVQALMQMGDEAIAAMPRAKLYGMLSYWRNFVPDFSARTHALKKLLGQDAGDWTPAHAEEVRHVLQVLLDGAASLNFDPSSPTIIETHTGPKGLATVCL